VVRGDRLSHEGFPTMSVVIPTYNRRYVLTRTLDLLTCQSRIPDEVVIVDQSEASEEREAIRKHCQMLTESGAIQVRYSYYERPRVYEARNVGARVANGHVILYLDDDILPDKRLVEWHARNYRDSSVDAVVGYIRQAHETEVFVDRLDVDLDPAAIAYRFIPKEKKRRTVCYCAAGNFSVRRSVLYSVGGWNELIVTYGDKEMGIHLCRHGHRIVYEPRARLVHLQVPRGGTRLSDRSAPWSPVQRAFSIMYTACRHLSGWDIVRFGLWRAARHTVLLKRNALDPGGWWSESVGLVRGVVKALYYADKARENYLADLFR